MKILIVDDNPDSREIMRTALELENFEVAEAEDGKKCLEKIKDEDFSVVLLDLSLPQISGWELAKKIKEKNETIKIIAVTAHAMRGDKEKAIEAGCDDYISKPLKPAHLIEKIKKIIK